MKGMMVKATVMVLRKIPGTNLPHYVKVEVDAEVQAIYFTKGTMRIKYQIEDLNGVMKNVTNDVSATPFFNKFEISEK